MMILSKHFIAIGVSAAGCKSLRQAALLFLGSRRMVVLFKQVGIVTCVTDSLNISASAADQVLSTRTVMLSGPADFHVFSFLKVFATTYWQSTKSVIQVVLACHSTIHKV